MNIDLKLRDIFVSRLIIILVQSVPYQAMPSVASTCLASYSLAALPDSDWQQGN